MPQVKLDIAPLRYLRGVVDRLVACLAVDRKEPPHLLLAFEIEGRRLVMHPVLVRHLFVFVDAEEDVLRLGMFRDEVVHVVRRDQRRPDLAGELNKLRVDLLLLLDAVDLQFNVEVLLSEELLILQSYLLRLVAHPAEKCPRDLAAETRAQRDQPLRVVLQQGAVDPRFVVKSVVEGGR